MVDFSNPALKMGCLGVDLLNSHDAFSWNEVGLGFLDMAVAGLFMDLGNEPHMVLVVELLQVRSGQV